MGKQPKTIFALDTGTRTVVGLVAEISPENARVLAVAMEEHRGRAMLDGQIHDIGRVAEVVFKIKQQLEQKLGCSLKKVAVAAAGRALVTMRQAVAQEVSPWHEIKEEQVRSLELEAIRKAQQFLVKGKEIKDKYYCVGYSVVSYQLDEQRIGNPVGQRGSLLGLELIATFLPQIVVDSLIAVLERAGLEMDVMTLEPIAALEFVVPPTMRQLNIALVDIGAGTSDIAITANGSVIAFAMVPLAGDEVTEQLCSSYLLDFMVGEKVKRRLKDGGVLSFKDILGVKHKIPSEEIIESIKETVKEIAFQIGNTILNLNGGPPQAVICIGGGSLTPCLTEELAKILGLPRHRVAVRPAEGVGSVKGLSRSLAGPNGVTPLGIAFMAARPQALGLTQVQVNDRTVRLFRGANATVVDALLAAGMGFTDLHGRPGRTLTVEVNGELQIIKGDTGEPAEIYLNGAKAELDTPLPPDAVIKVGEPRPGFDATAVIRDVLPSNLPVINILYNGESKALGPVIFMNGKKAALDAIIEDHAVITWHPVRTVQEALLALGFSEAQLSPNKLRLVFNGEQKEFSLRPFRIYKNSSIADLSDTISEGDELSYEPFTPLLRVGDLLNQENSDFPEDEINVFVNGESITLKGYGMRILKNGIRVDRDEAVEDGDEIQVSRDPEIAPILADIFNFFEFERTPPSATTRLVMLLNGRDAQFTTPIKDGDKIRIYWKDESKVADKL